MVGSSTCNSRRRAFHTNALQLPDNAACQHVIVAEDRRNTGSHSRRLDAKDSIPVTLGIRNSFQFHRRKRMDESSIRVPVYDSQPL